MEPAGLHSFSTVRAHWLLSPNKRPPIADRMVQQGHYGELSSILGAIPAQQALAAPEGREAADEPAEREPVQRLRAAAEEGDGEEEEAGEEEESDGEEGAEEGEGAEEESEEEGEEAEEAAAPGRGGAASQAQQGHEHEQQGQEQRRGKATRRHRMQTFVFSATLTLPANLRRRLRKGGGGASGSSDLDALMDKIPFRQVVSCVLASG